MAMAASTTIWVLAYDEPRTDGRIWAAASDLARRYDEVEILTLLDGEREPQQIVDGILVTRLDVLPSPGGTALWARARADSVRRAWRWARRDAPVTLVRVATAQIDRRLPAERAHRAWAAVRRAYAPLQGAGVRLGYWTAVRRLAAAHPAHAYHGTAPGLRVLAAALPRRR